MGNPLAAALASALLALTILTGCGASEEDRAADAAERFARAGTVNDYETFCDLLTEGARAPIEQFGRRLDVPADQRCSAALEAQGGTEQPDAEVEIGTVEVDGETASVQVSTTLPGKEPDDRVLQLQQDDSGDWLVADYGVVAPGT